MVFGVVVWWVAWGCRGGDVSFNFQNFSWTILKYYQNFGNIFRNFYNISKSFQNIYRNYRNIMRNSGTIFQKFEKYFQ